LLFKANDNGEFEKMKQIIPPHHRFSFATAVALLLGLMAISPWSEATAVGTWSYPQSEIERGNREAILEKQLADQELNYQTGHKFFTQRVEELAKLEQQIKLTRKTLALKKEPLIDAVEKYRQVQSLSLLDPMVSTEPQRLELLEVKQSTAIAIGEQKEKLDGLLEQIPQAKANVKGAVEKNKFILREIDSLMRHRDAVRELVFVQTVSD
jgi:hypothetical protein